MLRAAHAMRDPQRALPALALTLALGACWRDATPTLAPNGHVAQPGACPGIVSSYLHDSWLWNHELFAGCSPPPFYRDVTCEGGCPTPCRERDTDTRTAASQTIAFTYVDGRLVAADDRTSDRSSSLTPDHTYLPPYATPSRCTYEHDALSSCTTARGRFVVRRDAGGRITRIDEPTGSLAVSYDERGDATEFVVHGDKWITHNADVDTITATLRYDARHRVVEERGGGSVERFAYDRYGRLLDGQGVRRDYDPTTDLLLGVETISLSLTTFTYDAKRRPIRVTTQDFRGPSETWPFRLYETRYEQAYEYDCTP
jgi:hypothetical protein